MIVFLVTSVLEPCKKPFSYVARRSKFTFDQRLFQLIKSVHSIQEKFPEPNKHIFIIEGSTHLTTDQKKKLEDHLSCEILYHSSPFIDSPHKCQGEASLLLYGLDIVNQRFPEVQHLFKLSGRYSLNSKFSQKNFMEITNNIFREIEKGSPFFESNPCFYTFFYKIHKRDQLRDLCENILFNDVRESIEVLFYRKFKEDCVLVKELGVEGHVSHSGRFIEK